MINNRPFTESADEWLDRLLNNSEQENNEQQD
jgi:hypothetical protein